MAKFVIIGKEIVEGSFQGHDYKNLRLYCKSDESGNQTFVGEKVEVIKVKRDPAKVYNDLDVGTEIKVYYDRFGNVDEIVEV